MINNPPVSPSPIYKSDWKSRSPQIVSVVILLIVVVGTLVLQNKIRGLEPGYDDLQPKHHGWVTANTLAIISRATPENYFVGYALASKDNQNRAHYEYFDRYPVFFSALFNRILLLASDLAGKLYLAKQIMNLIFLGTLILAFLILDKLSRNKPLSLAATLLAFSNPYLLWYKDMVHFDQPALLGFLFLIYAIAVYKLDGRKMPLFIAPFIAVGLGRGYASYSILFLWFMIEAFLIVRVKELNWRNKFHSILRHPSFFLLVLAVLWGASLLLYNIIVEAHTRDVSIIQTSILRSARYRLSLNNEFNLENEGVINWQTFAEGQIHRIIQWSFPVQEPNFGLAVNSLILGFMLIMMGLMVWRQSLEKRIVYLILLLSGFGWLVPLRNLSAFHDYTAMYYIGIPLVFFLFIFLLLHLPRQAGYVAAILALGLYLFNIVQVKAWHEARADTAELYTYDFVHILEKIDGKNKNINMPEAIPYGPFPPGLYLSEHYLTSPEIADFVVTRNRKYPAVNLTPDNQIIFLFENSTPD